MAGGGQGGGDGIGRWRGEPKVTEEAMIVLVLRRGRVKGVVNAKGVGPLAMGAYDGDGG